MKLKRHILVPRAGDVVTITTPKTGQTWLLAQLRQLRRATDDRELAERITWLEGSRPNAPQPGRFRVFKSHLPIEEMRPMVEENLATRFITCLRAPHDVSLSLFAHIREIWAKRNGGDAAPFDKALTASDFALAGLPEGYEQSILEWLSLRDQPNVLVVFYEDMLADPSAALRRLAAFVGVELTAELEAETLKVTSYSNMAASPAFVNVFPGGGTYGRGRSNLTEAAVAAIDARWRQIVQPSCWRAATYEELYVTVRGAPFPI